jgi:hypothetical protein
MIALLKEKNDQIQSIHCVAHRLALAAAQGAKDVNYMQKFKATLCQLFYFYQNSPVRTAGLRAIQVNATNNYDLFNEILSYFEYFLYLQTSDFKLPIFLGVKLHNYLI